VTDARSGDDAADQGSPTRRTAFSLVVISTLALATTTATEELTLVVTGWSTTPGTDHVHDLTLSGMLWVALVAPMTLALSRPDDRVNAVFAPVLFLLPLAGFAAVVNSPILALPVLFGGLSLLALCLHPDGRDLLRFDRVRRVPLSLATLLAAAGVPLAVYAGFQVANQFTVPDEHTLLAHYGAMGVAAAYVLIMGVFAITRRRDWRFAAWSAGLVAAIVGAASVQSDAASSLGPVWGGLLVAWAVAFVVGVEGWRYRVRHRSVMEWSDAGG
jgi:formate-dependent nitrite reductase membrane component NrfD